jgi:hypothetical protein
MDKTIVIGITYDGFSVGNEDWEVFVGQEDDVEGKLDRIFTNLGYTVEFREDY